MAAAPNPCMGPLRSRPLALLRKECKRLLRLVLPILGSRLYAPLVHSSYDIKSALRLDPWTISKCARQLSFRREVEAIEFFLHNISTVYDAWQDGESGWIIMSYIPGKRADFMWPTLSPKQQENTASQVLEVLLQLGAPQPPHSGFEGSCSGGPGADDRIDNRQTFGPFESV